MWNPTLSTLVHSLMESFQLTFLWSWSKHEESILKDKKDKASVCRITKSVHNIQMSHKRGIEYFSLTEGTRIIGISSSTVIATFRIFLSVADLINEIIHSKTF